MRCIKSVLIAAILLMPSWVLADGVATGVAGSPGQRFYTTGILTTSGTFTPSVSVMYVTGCAAGGGGAGGFTVAAQGGGGGGSGGICVSNYPLSVTPGAVLTYTIGTAGVGGNAGAAGGIVNLNTTITGLPYGTFSLTGSTTAAGAGTATNGGAGGNIWGLGGGATTTGACNAGALQTARSAGGFLLNFIGGASGGGATGPAAGCGTSNNSVYNATGTNTPVAGGTVASGQAGGGAGGSSPYGVGGVGGTNGVSAGVGLPCTVGYGAGGGGGSSNAAGGNGCGGFLRFDWYN